MGRQPSRARAPAAGHVPARGSWRRGVVAQSPPALRRLPSGAPGCAASPPPPAPACSPPPATAAFHGGDGARARHRPGRMACSGAGAHASAPRLPRRATPPASRRPAARRVAALFQALRPGRASGLRDSGPTARRAPAARTAPADPAVPADPAAPAAAATPAAAARGSAKGEDKA